MHICKTSLGYIPRAELLGLRTCGSSTLIKNAKLFSKMVVPFEMEQLLECSNNKA